MIRFFPINGDPDYEDPAEGVDEMSMDDFMTFVSLAYDASVNPDVPAKTRRKCEESARVLTAEIDRRHHEAASFEGCEDEG
jgi:hypothetical protein